MPEWIFTFGVDHIHPTTQEPLGRRFVRITADSWEEARREMVRRWGQKWAFQYPTAVCKVHGKPPLLVYMCCRGAAGGGSVSAKKLRAVRKNLVAARRARKETR